MNFNKYTSTRVPFRKLGKLPKRYDKRTFKMANYLTTTLPTPPKTESWLSKVSNWPMMGNDTVGDCTCAGAGHATQLWTSYAQTVTFVPTTNQVLAMYSAITGYTPSNPNSDTGSDLLSVLNYWRNTGIAGHKILGYMQFAETKTPSNQVENAIYLFGCAYIGLQLPRAVQNMNSWYIPTGQALTGDWAPGSWGGHCVIVPSYDTTILSGPDGPSTKTVGLNVISWGEVIPMSWGFWNAYVDEAYAVLSADWINQSNLSPSNFNLTQLQSDLNSL